MIKSRFCPSPTGLIHIGNARTALFNALLARGDCDVFLLRIEDTDPERSRVEFVDSLQNDLRWLGANWQEGPERDAGNGPYFQSARAEIYEKYYNELIAKNRAYHCFCTEDELTLARKMQRRQGKPPRYAGTCRSLNKEQVEQQFKEGLQATLRFSIPENEVIEFTDIVRGLQKFQTSDLGDFIIRRANGTASFMYCNAIDDSLMGVTHALRGEDHLTNTPRQLLILQALGLNAPTYGHISLIVGDDGSPLSKRHGSKSLQELRELGFLPKAVLNYMARLGHTYTDHNELMSFEQCAQYFDSAKLVKASAKFDEQQLHHWQKEAMLALSDNELLSQLSTAIASIEPTQKMQFVQLIRANIIFPSDAKQWAERLFSSEHAFSEEQLSVLQCAGAVFFDEAATFIENLLDYKALCQHLKSACSVKGKALFMPLRIALTGAQHGPELAPVIDVLGRELVVKRLKQASQLC